MSSDTNAIPTLTTEQQGLFFDLIKNNVPSWLVNAPEGLRSKLYDSMIASHRSKSEADRLLAKIQSPEQFCSPLLAKALSDMLGKPLDVAGVIFQHVRSTSSLLGLRRKLVLPINRDLLTAACENFELSETLSGNYTDTSLIYIPEKITGTRAEILSIEPHQFAKLCRSLDLGKQYQNHLRTVFQFNDDAALLKTCCIAKVRDCFEVARHIARIRNHISEPVYQMLETVRNNLAPVRLGNNTLGYQALRFAGVTLHGAMFIGPVSEHDDDDYRCVVYLPGDPLHPLKEYASFSLFEMELSQRLKNADFRRSFCRFVKLADRIAFELACASLAFVDSGASVPVPLPLPRSPGYIGLSGDDFVGDPFSRIHRQRVEKMMADARLMVVPTDDEDEKTRLARWDTFKGIGIDALMFATSFLPVVGEVLLVASAVQLLMHVYEGVASWERGELEDATDHLFDIIENLALMFAFAGGVRVVGHAYRLVRSTDFIESLRCVRVSAVRQRLWKPDLKPYRQNRLLPKSLPADEQGLKWLGDQAYVSIDSHHYAVRQRAETGLWEVLAPYSAKETYNPVLETNGRGAWRHDSDRVQSWDRLTLFYRFGYEQSAIAPETAMQILTVSGLSDSVLRQIHVDRGQPPGLLVDTVRRFKADRSIREFIEQLREPLSAASGDPDLQLLALTSSPRWPATSAIRIVDDRGFEQHLYGSASASLVLELTQDSLIGGKLHQTLTTKMPTALRERLLDVTTVGEEAGQEALSGIISAQAQSMRAELFERVYQRTETTDNPQVKLLLDKHADLPVSVAEELVSNALSGELHELDAARIPLRLAEEANRFQEVIRSSRAYEGLYLDGAGGQGANRLVLDALEYLPGWPGSVFIQILEWSSRYGSVATSGVEQATERVVVSMYADRISVIDEGDAPITTFYGRTRDNYFRALWSGLSTRCKEALQVQSDASGKSLREKITQAALLRQSEYRGVQRGQPSPMRLAQRPEMLANVARTGATNAMIRRVQELYPSFSPLQVHQFIDRLGTDEIKILMHLELLRLEFSRIRNTLSLWVKQDTWYVAADGARVKTSVARKTRAMQTIVRCWRRETAGEPSADALATTLRFAPEPWGDLPSITGDFSHVGHLIMDDVIPGSGLNAFLRNFKHLRSLSLRGNRLREVPEHIASMQWLNTLDLSNNQLHLNAASTVRLEGLTSLRTLHLDFNPGLERVPDLGSLLHLQVLTLRGTGLDQWPQSVSRLAAPSLVDLRDNRISSVPAEVIKRSQVITRATELHGNPLTPQTRAQIAAQQQVSGLSFGISTLQGSSTPGLANNRGSDAWLTGINPAKSHARRVIWDSLRNTPGSRDFFNVIAQLTGTAEFTHVYNHFRERVWEVLKAVSENERLRLAIFSTARGARASVDGYSALFSDMEVQVLGARASAVVQPGSKSLEQHLAGLLRGLFRLHKLEEVAMLDINSLHTEQAMDYDQALQISLAYRVGLAERLSLPLQARQVTTPWRVEVSQATLDHAYEQVMTAERSDALVNWSSRQVFWIEHLKVAYPDRFAAIDDEAALAMRQLEEQEGLTAQVAATRMNAIVENFNNARQALIRQLSAQALAQSPQGEPAASDGVAGL